MEIAFDPKKAASNLKKHGVSFDEAKTALLDSLALVRDDPDAPARTAIDRLLCVTK
jgi:uncharacterized protein